MKMSMVRARAYGLRSVASNSCDFRHIAHEGSAASFVNRLI